MTNSTARKQLLGRVLASLVFGVALLPSTVAVQTPAHAEGSGLDQFIERLKKKKAKQSGQPAAATTNANDAHSLPANAGKAVTDTEVVVAKNIAPMLAETGAAELRNAAERYREIVASGGFPKMPRANLKKGSTGKHVITLNKRLFIEGYVRAEATEGEFASIYTSATEDGVRRFQQNMGLAATGRFDAVTADAMNVPAQRRLAAIEANIPRIETYAKDLGDRYIVVNIPAQQIETVSGGRVFSKHNAIVGRPERPSPVVMAPLANVAFNPYWNAPVSIVEKDIIPKMKGGTDVLRDMNIKVFKGFGGPEIDPDSVNWRTAIPDDYHFRQEPGEGNAMASAKINFTSPFGVYMHDTPEKHLFNSNNRFYSSGCVRVQDMSLLVNWVLNGQDGIGEAEIATLAETLERRDVTLSTPPQLRFSYLTAWPTTGGTVAFRNDIYDLDGTGFVVGQPMPKGEVSPDGQRYVLKPLPRLVASVEDENSSGGFFGFSKKGKDGKPVKRPAFFKSTSFNDDKGADDLSNPAKTKNNEPVTKKAKSAETTKSKTKAKPKVRNGKDKPGLFDWAEWRKEQAAAAKGGKKKVVKKTVKDDEKSKTASAKKKVDDKKVAASDKTKTSTTAKKKSEDTESADAGKKKAEDSKAAEATKKPAAKKLDCKPGKDGKLPDGCKAAEAAKKKPATATN